MILENIKITIELPENRPNTTYKCSYSQISSMIWYVVTNETMVCRGCSAENGGNVCDTL